MLANYFFFARYLARLVKSIASSASWRAYKQSCQITALMLFSFTYIARSSHVPGTHFNPWVERVHKKNKVICPRLQ